MKKHRRYSAPESSLSSLSSIPSTIIDNIHSLSIFSSLSTNSISNLLETLHFRRLQNGETLIEQGSQGKSMFFILSGKLQVIDEGKEVIIAELGEGDIVGEIGVLFNISRTASVRAVKGPCTVGTLHLQDLVKLRNKNYEIYKSIWKLARDRYISRNLERFSKPSSIKSIRLKKRVFERLKKEFKNEINEGFIIEGDENQIMAFVDCEMKIFVIEGSIIYQEDLGKEPIILNANQKFHALSLEPLGYIQANPSPIIMEREGMEVRMGMEKRQTNSHTKKQMEKCRIFISGIKGKNMKKDIERLKLEPTPAKSPSTHLIWSDEAILSAPRAIPNISRLSNLNKMTEVMIEEKNLIENESKSKQKEQERQQDQEEMKNDKNGKSSKQLDWSQFDSCSSLVQEILKINRNTLESINLSGCWYANDSCLQVIEDNCFNSLKSINLQDCLSISEGALAHFFQSCNRLTLVNCSNCSGISAISLCALNQNENVEYSNEKRDEMEKGNRINPIQHLNIGHCHNIGIEGWNAIGKMTTLQELILKRCPEINAEMIKKTSIPQFQSLIKLDLAECCFLNNESIIKIISNASRLCHLNLAFCQGLTATFPDDLVLSLAKLEFLDISFTFIDEIGIEKIVRRWPNIKSIKATNCKIGSLSSSLLPLFHSESKRIDQIEG